MVEAQQEQSLATQWKRARGEVVELPSGKRARLVQSLNMAVAIKAGKIPNPLRTIIKAQQDMAQSGGVSDKPMPTIDSAEALAQFGDLMAATVCSAFVDPVCRMPPKEDKDGNPINQMLWYPENPDEISYFDLSTDDRYFIYGVAQGGATDLESFRQRQKQFMESLADGEKVQVPTKRPARPRKKKA